MNAGRHFRVILAIGALVVLAALGGCATPAQHAQMVPPAPVVARDRAPSPLHQAISIGNVGGGEATNPLMYSTVEDGELREALRLALSRSGFLSGPQRPAPLRLDAFLLELKHPFAGFTTDVDAFIRYTLSRVADGRVLFDDIVVSSFSLSASDVFYGVERLRLANEGAIRNNLAELVRRLETVDVRQ